MRVNKLFCALLAICVFLFWAIQLGCLRGSEDTNREDDDISGDDTDDDVDDDTDDDTDDDVDDDADDDSDDDTDDDADDDTCEASIELIDGDSSYPASGHTSLAIDADDALHVGYQKVINLSECSFANFWYATNKNGSWEKNLVEDGYCYYEHVSSDYYEKYENIGDSNDIVLDGSDSPWLSYNLNYFEHVYYADDITNYYTLEGFLKYTPIPAQIQILDSDTWSCDECSLSSYANYTGSANSMVLDDNGVAHIAYNKWKNEGWNYLAYTVAGTSAKDVSYLDICSGLIDDVSIAIDSNSNLHIIYLCGASLKYTTDASGSWESATVAPVHGAVYLSLAVDSGDSLHISYSSNDSLMYATNASGTWVITTVDADEDVGYYNSLVLDADNRAHISYYDEANGDLKYATNESGDWHICTIDSQGDVGKNTSIALDSAGMVHIVYTGENGLWHAAFSQGGPVD